MTRPKSQRHLSQTQNQKTKDLYCLRAFNPVEDGPSVTIAGRLKRQDSLSPEHGDKLIAAEFPLFVPTREKGRYKIHFDYPYQESVPLPPDDDDHRKQRVDAVAAFRRNKFKNLDGFVLFDETAHYQIIFPTGW